MFSMLGMISLSMIWLKACVLPTASKGTVSDARSSDSVLHDEGETHGAIGRARLRRDAPSLGAIQTAPSMTMKVIAQSPTCGINHPKPYSNLQPMSAL
jgi:hypothetical protein